MFPTNTPATNPCGFIGSHLKSNGISILVDTGASVNISSYPEDFVGGSNGIIPVPNNLNTIKGLSGNCNASGFGTVHWEVKDTQGLSRTIEGPCYYVPDAV